MQREERGGPCFFLDTPGSHRHQRQRNHHRCPKASSRSVAFQWEFMGIECVALQMLIPEAAQLTRESLTRCLHVRSTGHSESESTLRTLGQPDVLVVTQSPVRMTLLIRHRGEHEAVLHRPSVSERNLVECQCHDSLYPLWHPRPTLVCRPTKTYRMLFRLAVDWCTRYLSEYRPRLKWPDGTSE
jgi:hypothetical protein